MEMWTTLGKDKGQELVWGASIKIEEVLISLPHAVYALNLEKL